MNHAVYKNSPTTWRGDGLPAGRQAKLADTVKNRSFFGHRLLKLRLSDVSQ
jgi:hypothetical protein